MYTSKNYVTDHVVHEGIISTIKGWFSKSSNNKPSNSSDTSISQAKKDELDKKQRIESGKDNELMRQADRNLHVCQKLTEKNKKIDGDAKYSRNQLVCLVRYYKQMKAIMRKSKVCMHSPDKALRDDCRSQVDAYVKDLDKWIDTYTKGIQHYESKK